MGSWSVLRSSLIELIVLFMLLFAMLFIYLIENARFGKCKCEPKMVAMKGTKIIYYNPIFTEHQKYGCICDARYNSSYMTMVFFSCILFGLCGNSIIFRYCCKNEKLTSKIFGLVLKIGSILYTYYHKYNENKEQKENNNKQVIDIFNQLNMLNIFVALISVSRIHLFTKLCANIL